MKLKIKTFVILGLVYLFFLACTYFEIIRFNLLSFVLVTTLFFLGILGSAVYFLLLRRIEQLNQKLIHLNAKYTQPLATIKRDEFASIDEHINHLTITIETLERQREQETAKNTEVLKQKNAELEKILTEQSLTEKRFSSERECLTQIAKYDTLTSLPNRVFFNEILNKSLNHAKRYSKILSILLIDLDSFKTETSMLTPENKNLLLAELGKRFISVLRTEDTLAKLDGEEFIVLLNDIKKSKFASTVAEKILKACSEPINIDSHTFCLKASIGICVYPFDGDSLENLLKSADSALYKAKHVGGNIYQFYTHEMDVEAREYLQLESALRKAIHNNELALYYQPKLNLKKGSIIGLEALMRWEHPVLGIISPAKFIPLAEETGLILQISEWALLEACKMNIVWQKEGYEHLTISLNLSPKQFHHPNIVKIIENVLHETGLNPAFLELEITEQTIMDDVEMAGKILEKLKATGV